MTDYPESAKIQIEELRRQLSELEAWQAKYREAAGLWDSLGTEAGDQITDAVLIAKIYDFERGLAEISISCTDSVDWVDQIGIISAAMMMLNQDKILPSKGDDGLL